MKRLEAPEDMAQAILFLAVRGVRQSLVHHWPDHRRQRRQKRLVRRALRNKATKRAQNEKPQHRVPGLGQPLAYIRRAIATILNVAGKSEQLMTVAGPFGGDVNLRCGGFLPRLIELRRFRLEDELRFGEVLPALRLGEPFPVLFRMVARLLAAQKRDRATTLGVFHHVLPGCAIYAIHGRSESHDIRTARSLKP